MAEIPPDLPIDAKRAFEDFKQIQGRIGNSFSISQLQEAIRVEQVEDEWVLRVAFEGEPDPAGSHRRSVTLLDGTQIDPVDIVGRIYFGPYPFASFEKPYITKRFADDEKIKAGRAELEITPFFERTIKNSEGWRLGPGTFILRFELFEMRDGQEDKRLGLYDTFAAVARRRDGRFVEVPAILEGPMFNRPTKTRATISYVTNRDVPGQVFIRGMADCFKSEKPRQLGAHWFRHEIEIDGLQPDTIYEYSVRAGETRSSWYRFRTAPSGPARVRFAFAGDGRGGQGGNDFDLMGTNFRTMERLTSIAFQQGADLLLMGGDFIAGYTSSRSDFRTQVRAWKQSVAGFAAERPVYSVIGNHEALVTVFDDGLVGLGFDQWPYETHSTEAIFAQEFVHPPSTLEAPANFPTYEDNTYAFQYGPVYFIAFNNNYWVEVDQPEENSARRVNRRSEEYGGCPEGYLMPDQVAWIKAEIERADRDPSVHHIVLFAQEPIFPNGIHVQDAMWYFGDNTVRAWIFDPQDAELRPAGPGLIDVRNDLVRAIAASPKVAVVLGSDEHAYYRTLIGPEVPIGDPAKDPELTEWTPGSSVQVSSLEDLKRRTWYVVCGGAGAPFSGELDSPWNDYWKSQPHTDLGYRYSPQEHIILFDVTEDRFSMRAVNIHGETIDEVENLLALRPLLSRPWRGQTSRCPERHKPRSGESAHATEDCRKP